MRHIRRLTTVVIALALASMAAAESGDIVVQDAGTGKIYCRSQRFLVPYEAADSGPAGISAVRLYFTCDAGSSWTLFGEKPEAKGSFEFVAPGDGVYGFTVVAVDKAGNVERKDGPSSGTRPEISVVVDTKEPQILPVFPRQDLELAPGAHLTVRFRADDASLAPSTASIAVKTRDSSLWETVEGVAFDKGEFSAQNGVLFPGRYDVKIAISDRAGNAAEEVFSFVCTTNATPPAQPSGPTGRDWVVPIQAPPRAKSLVFDIDYSVEDIGGQPPAQVGLWYTTDAGATWQFYGLDPDAVSPLRFQAPREGVYGFKITAVTRSGIEEPRPMPGTKPDFVTLVDITYPTLMLDDPRGGESYAGGQPHFVKWTARDDNFGSLPISLYVARDGGDWEILASDLPNNGAYGWNVPLIEYATFRLRIEARDIVGNVTSVISDNFFVVSAAPESRIRAVVPAVPLIGIKDLSVAPSPAASARSVPAAEPAPEPAAQASPNDEEAKALVDRATGLRLRGDYDAAEKELREAIRLDPHAVTARNELGAILTQSGRHEEALDVLREARRLAPGDADVLYNVACAYYALGDYADAAAAFETLSGLDPGNEAILWNLAKSWLAAGDVAKARATWVRIIDLNRPGSPYVRRARQALQAIADPSAMTGAPAAR